MRTIYENWNGHIVKLTWKPKINIQDDNIKITSVHAVCVHENKIVLSLIRNRGFNIPGGHIELGESIEDGLHREVFEEAYVKGTLTYLGCLEVNHEENPNFDPHGKYPLIAYQAFYRMDITECCSFLREHESKARVWVERSEISYVINDHELIYDIIDDAFAMRDLIMKGD